MTREEAIETIKRCCTEGSQLRKACTMFIPELRESEDERIIRAINNMLPFIPDEAYANNGVTKEGVLNYLEKQKEQGQPCDSAQFEEGFKTGLELGLRKKKEQKPADDEAKAIAYREYERGRESGLRDGQKYVLDNAESYGLCKPAEWSEEDENNLELVIDCIYKFYPDPVMKYKLKEWLKSLRPQPKQNVSDTVITPNKEFFQWIYDRLVNVHNENPNVDYMISFKRRIEELSVDKPSWKPSEEQIKALYCALNDAISLYSDKVSPLYEEISRTHFDALESLYNDLKKL